MTDEERYVDCDSCGERFEGEAIIRQYMADRGRGNKCITCAGGPGACRECNKRKGSTHRPECSIGKSMCLPREVFTEHTA